MKKTLITVAAIAGLTLGGFTAAGVASAQADGSGSNVDVYEIVEIQAETDGTDTDGSDTDGSDASEHRGRKGNGKGCGLSTAAEAIGIDEASLRAALDSGDTIADVATANGVDPESVVEAMVSAKADRLADKVADGDLTQAEADERLASKAERTADRVYGVDDTADA